MHTVTCSSVACACELYAHSFMHTLSALNGIVGSIRILMYTRCNKPKKMTHETSRSGHAYCCSCSCQGHGILLQPRLLRALAIISREVSSMAFCLGSTLCASAPQHAGPMQNMQFGVVAALHAHGMAALASLIPSAVMAHGAVAAKPCHPCRWHCRVHPAACPSC
jgi:hypothetical protein